MAVMAPNDNKIKLDKDELKQVSGGAVIRVKPSVDKVRNKGQAGGDQKKRPIRRDSR
jgi:bacteriocin-like protein